MTARKLERLVNLLLCLMASRRYLTVAEIGAMVDGYDRGDTEDDHEAFRRMFERDKEDLRGLGVPLETGRHSVWEDEVGYRISRADYELPALHLDPEEAAALALAMRLWSADGLLASASRSAQMKLMAAGVATVPPPPGVEPRVEGADPAVERALLAARARQVVRFGYRSARQTDPAERTVEPWGVVGRRGRWYLVGRDRQRAAARCFRLSRLTGPLRTVGPPEAFEVPAGVDLQALVAQGEPGEDAATARLLVRQGRGHDLRRRPVASRSGPPVDADAAGVPAGWDRLEIAYGEPERLAEMLAGLGADVLVVEPADVAAQVRDRLAAVLRLHAPTP